MKKILVLFIWLFILFSCAEKKENNLTNTWKLENVKTNLIDNNKNMKTTKKLENGDVVALIKTTKWQIEIFLETKKAPITAANFIWLAKKWYYDGIIFHRVIKDFMIQWWDPTWTGAGWESIYWEKFKDEFDKDLKNDKFTISMANAWKDTNGSQFFINVADNNLLDFKHSVFGEVISWEDNVLNISKVKTSWADKPEKEVKIISIDIKEYKDWKFVDYNFDEKKAVENYKNAEKEKKSSPVKDWDLVKVHYTGTFENGEKFDSSYDRNEPIEFKVWSGMMIKGFDNAVVWMKIWEKKSIVIKPEDAYGKYDEKNTFEITLSPEDKKYIAENDIKLKVWEKFPTNAWLKEIKKIDWDKVTIDINHELAWKTLKFDIEIVDKK